MAKKNKSRKTRNKTRKAGSSLKVMSALPPAKHTEISELAEKAGGLIASGRAQSAVSVLEQGIEIEPANPELHLLLADAYEAMGEIQDSIASFKTAIKLAPGFLPAMVNFGTMLLENQHLEAAQKAFAHALAYDDQFLPALDGLQRTLEDLRRYPQAADIAEKIARLRGATSDLEQLARLKDLASDKTGAIKATTRALAVSNDKARIHTLAGMIELSHGDNEAANDRFSKALEENSLEGFAHLYLSRSRSTDASSALAAVNNAINDADERSIANVRAPLHFARAHLLDRLGDIEAAFDAFQNANALIADIRPDDNDARSALSAAHMARFTPSAIADTHAQQEPDMSRKPVFVTGLPRSGTTLVERILTAHDKAQGLGELELIPHLTNVTEGLEPVELKVAAKTYRLAYPEKFQHQQRVIDKSISSLLHIGRIFALFPNARVVICERHPMDTAWSAFKEYFNDGALAYTYSFERIAAHQAIYATAADHWKTTFPDKVMTVRYENIVQNPEPHTRALLDHIGLEWQDQCLSFHEQKTTVRTASLVQARQPIYTSSIGRWQPYGEHLKPLQTLLQPRIDEFNAQA